MDSRNIIKEVVASILIRSTKPLGDATVDLWTVCALHVLSAVPLCVDMKDRT